MHLLVANFGAHRSPHFSSDLRLNMMFLETLIILVHADLSLIKLVQTAVVRTDRSRETKRKYTTCPNALSGSELEQKWQEFWKLKSPCGLKFRVLDHRTVTSLTSVTLTAACHYIWYEDRFNCHSTAINYPTSLDLSQWSKIGMPLSSHSVASHVCQECRVWNSNRGSHDTSKLLC